MSKVLKEKRLSSLQFLILGILLDRDCPGRTVRDRLAEFGEGKTGPAFYRLMSRMEDAGVIVGRYDHEVVAGQMIRQRIYRVSAEGRRKWDAQRAFQDRVVASFGNAGVESV